MLHRSLSPNVLLQCPIPVVRRQIEAALLSNMPNATLYEATDWAGAETLSEEHDMDIVLLTIGTHEANDLANLADLRHLQPDSRFIVLSLNRLPDAQRNALEELDISTVSLRHLAPTLLRPVAPEWAWGGVHPDSDGGAGRAVQWVDRARARPGG